MPLAYRFTVTNVVPVVPGLTGLSVLARGGYATVYDMKQGYRAAAKS